MVSCVGCADWEAMALMGQRRVESTARPRNRNFPHTCWTNFLPCLSKGGAVDVCVANCCLAP